MYLHPIILTLRVLAPQRKGREMNLNGNNAVNWIAKSLAWTVFWSNAYLALFITSLIFMYSYHRDVMTSFIYSSTLNIAINQDHFKKNQKIRKFKIKHKKAILINNDKVFALRSYNMLITSFEKDIMRELFSNYFQDKD